MDLRRSQRYECSVPVYLAHCLSFDSDLLNEVRPEET